MEDPLPYDPHPSTPLPIPPLDHAHLLSSDFFPENGDDFNFGAGFDFTFDDLTFADDLLLDPQGDGVFDSDVSDVLEGRNSGDSEILVGNPNSRVYDCSSPEGVNHHGGVSSEESNFGVKLNCASPESGSCKSNSGVSQTFRGGDSGNISDDRDVSSSSFNENNVDDLSSKVKVEEIGGKNNNHNNNVSKSVVSKRKKEYDHDQSEEGNKTNKFRKSGMSENVSVEVGSVDGDDKKKARLMRNRESAQLSRQRKKQYVEELKDKVRSMHSTITDLNGKISYMMAENASLRQQLAGAGGVCAAPPPPHGMYPMAPMPYPWMACPPYMVKPQGSHVPLVPIPRLKPQQPAPAPKVSRRSDSKKGEGKTKKVASVSLLGLLFCMLLFGGLVPLVNVKYGGIGFDGVQKGSVFMVDKHVGVLEGKISSHGRILQQSNSSDGFGPNGNSSEPLVASLYVPRNDKLVKIDGNLIIHSVLASEKAMASKTDEESKPSEETSLAIHGSYPPYPIPGPGSNNWRHPHLDRNQNGRQRALGSSSSEGFTPAGSDGKLQQWFREGLAGPMLSSGMCTEVFQFDISPTPGSVVPATSIVNVTSERQQNSTRSNKPRNRRILHEPVVPLDGHTLNATEEHVAHEQNDGLQGNRTSSSMVVSVLVDPREVGDGDGEGVIRSKTMSRIFVVVLIDSVKYVTYSCMLPFLGSSNHLVTT
ncbi:bZIP transcription factor 17-like [Chenopodium quinoa]|uniref:bZIP transcription factor 17-like n=1 Tax=Chenopodium quinoa TaxID=63459 RepID=UPI000B784730|nr:bZIP transcription factor 17-like [Chenopodium quinoa]